MAIQPIGSGSIWSLNAEIDRGPLSRLFAGQVADRGGTATDLFAVSDPLDPSNSVSGPLAALFAVPGNLAIGSAKLAELFAAAQAGEPVSADGLLAWLASLNGTGETGLGGSTTVGLPAQPDVGAASASILTAVFQPQLDAVGQIVDLLS